MNREFWDAFLATQDSATERPEVQTYARAIQQSIPPAMTQVQQGGLAYPYPGRGVSGESSN